MKRILGQVDLRQLLLPGMVSMAMSAVAWFGGTTWAYHNAAEDLRRTVEAHAEALKPLQGLPTEDLKKLPARVERIEAFAESYRDAQDKQSAALSRIETLIRHRGGVVQSSGH